MALRSDHYAQRREALNREDGKLRQNPHGILLMVRRFYIDLHRWVIDDLLPMAAPVGAHSVHCRRGGARPITSRTRRESSTGIFTYPRSTQCEAGRGHVLSRRAVQNSSMCSLRSWACWALL